MFHPELKLGGLELLKQNKIAEKILKAGIDVLLEEEDVEREEIKGVFAIMDGVARFIPITTGVADQKRIQVLSGLEEGGQVISGPYRVLRTIKDGDEVEVDNSLNKFTRNEE